MKVLIIKTSSLGDIVQTFSLLPFLIKKCAGVQIDWVVESRFAALVESHPLVNQVYQIDTRSWKKAPWKKRGEIQSFYKHIRKKHYEVVFDLQGNIKSAAVLAFVRANDKVGFGRKSVPEWPNLLFTNRRYDPPCGRNIREDYFSLLSNYFHCPQASLIEEKVTLNLSTQESLQQLSLEKKLTTPFPLIMVCSGSAWTNKQLPVSTLGHFLQLIQKQIGAFFLFTWGSQEEKEMANALHKRVGGELLEKMSLPLLHALMGKMACVITMDSLPLHLAALSGSTTFSVFGASSAKKYKPLGERHEAFQGSCPYGKTFEKRCPILRKCQTGACIKSLSAEALFALWSRWWKELDPTAPKHALF